MLSIMSFLSLLCPGSSSPFALGGSLTQPHGRPPAESAAVTSLTAVSSATGVHSHMSAVSVVNPTTPNSDAGPKLKKPHLNPLNKPATGPKPPLKHQQLSPVKPQTPVNPTRLEYWLQGYSPTKTQFLLSGFKHGFKLGYEGPRGPQSSPNLKSALAHPAIVTDKIQSEIKAGRISGPHPIKPLPNLKLSPLGIVPKKKPGEYRLIHHLSYPRNSNQWVNSHIPDERPTVSYAGIQEAIAKIKTLGRGCHMSKTDIVSAYRICPINTVDHELLGFSWEGQFYFDLCLPFGARSACQLFEEVSTALEWIAVNKLGCQAVVHILDDFLFINTTKVGCSRDLAAFISMCTDVGIPIAEDKTFSANTFMSFVGISLCSLTMEASLPEDKLRQCQNMLRTFLSRNSCRLRQLQSLLGFLNFCCSVITCGRAFLRRLIDLTMGISKPYLHICLNQEVKSDMQLWLKFLEQYNGKSMFLNEAFLSSLTLSLYTDSAQSLGYGAVYGSQWFYGPFPLSWQTLNITCLELYPIVVAVQVWGPLWRNHSLLFYTDNEALVAIINKQSSKDKTTMSLLRPLILACLHFNILFQARHVAGSKNLLADALSRQDIPRFRRLSPKSNLQPAKIPSHLLPENFFQLSMNC